jgi:hypothetical protein
MRWSESDADEIPAGVTLLETRQGREKILPTTVDMQIEFNYHGHA